MHSLGKNFFLTRFKFDRVLLSMRIICDVDFSIEIVYQVTFKVFKVVRVGSVFLHPARVKFDRISRFERSSLSGFSQFNVV